MNLTLMSDFYELTMLRGYLRAGFKSKKAVFDLFYRKNPCGNGYAIAAGLEQAAEYIENLRFGPDDLDYLREVAGFDAEFLGRRLGHVLGRQKTLVGRSAVAPERQAGAGDGRRHAAQAHQGR